MLSSLANYLLGGNISNAQNAREAPDNETLEAFPVMARLRQVMVEGDDWILIDPTVEGASALEESWYVTPPACFTRAGPVNVETSPLEDLLIEHPSMSVYRASSSPLAPNSPTPTSPATLPVQVKVSGKAARSDDEDEPNEEPEVDDAECEHIAGIVIAERFKSRTRQRRRNKNDRENRRRNVIHEKSPQTAMAAEKVRIVQLRSAQKVFEKRSSQALKRGRLDRSNKLREVFSVKGKRPRRQDRLRVQNSGANNNRKC